LNIGKSAKPAGRIFFGYWKNLPDELDQTPPAIEAFPKLLKYEFLQWSQTYIPYCFFGNLIFLRIPLQHMRGHFAYG
jgi:hypothetical protein